MNSASFVRDHGVRFSITFRSRRDRPECRSGRVDSGGRGIRGFNCKVAIKWSAGADPLLSLIFGYNSNEFQKRNKDETT